MNEDCLDKLSALIFASTFHVTHTADVQRAIAASVVESIKVLEASRPSDIHGPPVGEGVAYYRALAGRTIIRPTLLMLKDVI